MVSPVFSNPIDSVTLRPDSSTSPGSGWGRAASPGAAELRPPGPLRPCPARPRSDGGRTVPAAAAPHGRLQQRRGRGSRAGPAGGAADGAAAGGRRAVSGGAGGSGTRPRSELGERDPAVSHGFCSTIVLNNPRRRNALSLPMLQSLRRDLLHDVKSRELRVIVIAGTAAPAGPGHTAEPNPKPRWELREAGRKGPVCFPNAPAAVSARQASLSRSSSILTPASPFLYLIPHS